MTRTTYLIIISNCLAVVILLGLVITQSHTYSQKFLPGMIVDGLVVGGLTFEAAREQLAVHHQQQPAPNFSLTLQLDSTIISSSSAQLGLHRQYDQALSQAYSYGHSGPKWRQVTQLITAYFTRHKFHSPLAYDAAQLEQLVTVFAAQVDLPGQPPAMTLATSGNPKTLTIQRGQPGLNLDRLTTLQRLKNSLTQSDSSLVTAVAASASTVLSDEQLPAALSRGQNLVGKQAIFKAPDVTIKLSDKEMIKLLQLPQGYNPEQMASATTTWVSRTNRPAQNAVFEYDPNTLEVKKFVPHKDGLSLEPGAATELLSSSLQRIEEASAVATSSAQTTFEFTLPVTTTPPSQTLASTNTLGVKERIAVGESEFAHSAASRVHNVKLASSRIDLAIIKPGEEFSFNKRLGEVTQATGFLPAYVIMKGQTVLGDGGGVCQVSTTTFRAALNAGLPITRRRAHSYRVSYYEQDKKPGIDATVYSGEVDLRFVNDTGNHIVIRTEVDPTRYTMKVELYGTSDGRSTQIVDHKTWGYRPPPAPQYTPTDTLPHGVVKQVDWPAAGIYASFKNVIRDKTGTVVRTDQYDSNYIPWSAKYLRGV